MRISIGKHLSISLSFSLFFHLFIFLFDCTPLYITVLITYHNTNIWDVMSRKSFFERAMMLGTSANARNNWMTRRRRKWTADEVGDDIDVADSVIVNVAVRLIERTNNLGRRRNHHSVRSEYGEVLHVLRSINIHTRHMHVTCYIAICILLLQFSFRYS